MIKVWQRLEIVVLLVIVAGVLVGFLTSMRAALLPALVLVLILTALARQNHHRKRYQLLAWEDAYAEWAALRYEDSDRRARHHDLYAAAHDVFALDVGAMGHRWWEADIAAYVGDTRTWNAVLAWMRRTSASARPTSTTQP